MTKNYFACGLQTDNLDVSTVGMRNFLKEILSELRKAKKQKCEESWDLLKETRQGQKKDEWFKTD